MFHPFNLSKELRKDKSIARILLNWHIEKHCAGIRGVVLDIASGDPSYYKYLPARECKVIRADYAKKLNPDIVLDMDRAFPFQDNAFGNVLFFNALYIAKFPEQTLQECFRVLKHGGALYVSSPFIFNESREPHDYYRFTSEKLEELLRGAGFQDVVCVPMGERFTAASFLVGKFLFFWPLRFLLYSCAIFFDSLLSKKVKTLHPCPIGYFCIARK